MRSRLACAAVSSLTAAVLFAASPVAGATGAERLADFLDRVETFEAEFEQRVIDRRGDAERSLGRFWMHRPGRFRWEYHEPYERVIVADGELVWLYEPDLEQATTRRLEEAGVGDTPAALLTGREDVLDRFRAVESWEEDGLSWIKLEPRQPEADFASLTLAFRGADLARLELEDRLGQLSLVSFSGLRVNEPPDAARFRLDLPDGVDVITDDEL